MGSAHVVAVLVGIGIGVQVAVVGGLSERISPLAISLGLQLAGLAVGSLWLAGPGSWSDVAAVAVRWWWLPLGALGWLLVAALGYSSLRIGVAATLGLAVGAQMLAGLGFDVRRGLVEPGLRPLAGAALLVAGVVLVASGTDA